VPLSPTIIGDNFSSTGLCLAYVIFNEIQVDFFWVVLEFELSGLCLLGRLSTAWDTPPAPFCSGYSGDKVSLFAQGDLNHDPSILCFLPELGWQMPFHCTAFFIEMGSCEILTWAGLEMQSSHKWLELQEWATGAWLLQIDLNIIFCQNLGFRIIVFPHSAKPVPDTYFHCGLFN
jgi:hypothetical protein